MFESILYKISAERTDLDNNFYSPFYYQQLKAYEFCVKFCKNKNVLEVGFGGGHGASFLSKSAKKVIAIDNDRLAVRSAKEKYKNIKNLKFIESDIGNFNSIEKYNCIVSLQVIEHIPTESVIIYIQKIKSLLKSNGLLILSTPYSVNTSYNENPYHFKEYTFEELREMLSWSFSHITFYSITGDPIVDNFEVERKRTVTKTLSKDFLNIRKIIPIKPRQILFDIMSYRKRNTIDEKFKKITTKNYHVEKGENKKAIDVVVVCRP